MWQPCHDAPRLFTVAATPAAGVMEGRYRAMAVPVAVCVDYSAIRAKVEASAADQPCDSVSATSCR